MQALLKSWALKTLLYAYNSSAAKHIAPFSSLIVRFHYPFQSRINTQKLKACVSYILHNPPFSLNNVKDRIWKLCVNYYVCRFTQSAPYHLAIISTPDNNVGSLTLFWASGIAYRTACFCSNKQYWTSILKCPTRNWLFTHKHSYKLTGSAIPTLSKLFLYSIETQ